ncbi:MAG: 1-acyl-sn-glycerol-3-phosphate acyltransferase [Tannerellaceae bacterium]|nr:1-acyl-sn-glycerol-3-phosphate acyltransferase [Tannerellaceae bacterium]
MKKRFLQAICLRIIYKGFARWILKLFVGVRFSDCSCLKKEDQFIIVANHNSHLDTISLLASLPGSLLWKVKPVAAEDYFGNTRLKAACSNYFINTLLIQRKGVKEEENHPLTKMLTALEQGYSLILFPEGTRGEAEKMDRIKPGIARLLAARPGLKYVPVYLSGMGRSLPKGKILILPYQASVNYGVPTLPVNNDPVQILEQIQVDFDNMAALCSLASEEED